MSLARQRNGMGIIKIDIKADVDNELRPQTPVDAKGTTVEGQNTHPQAEIPPADANIMLIELPIEGAAAARRQEEETMAGLLP